MTGIDDELKALVKNDALRLLVKLLFTMYIGCFVLLVTLFTVGFSDKEIAKYIYPSTKVLLYSVYLPYVGVYVSAALWWFYCRITGKPLMNYYVTILAIVTILTLVPFVGLIAVSGNLKRFAYECDPADPAKLSTYSRLFGEQRKENCRSDQAPGAIIPESARPL